MTKAWATGGDGEDVIAPIQGDEPIVPPSVTSQMSPVASAPDEAIVELATSAILRRAATSRLLLFTREQPDPLSAAASSLLRFLGVEFDEVPLVQVTSAAAPAGLGSLPKDALKRALSLEAGGPFLPQLYVDGRYLCGGQGLVERVIMGSFHALLDKRRIACDTTKLVADTHVKRKGDRGVPCDVAAWLQLQQLRSEKIQFQMLQLQNLGDVWRNPAFRTVSATLRLPYRKCSMPCMITLQIGAGCSGTGCRPEADDLTLSATLPASAFLHVFAAT